MIVVDLKDGVLSLHAVQAKLKPNQISQIRFWGFTNVSITDTYTLSSDQIDTVLLKVLRYFDKEGVSQSLTPSCADYLSKVTSAIDTWQAIRASGRRYKEGTFDQALFDEFASFVNNFICRKLKSHQLKAAFHLYLVRNGANFSVPGSGKTSVVLTVYERLRMQSEVNMLYVVGPPACFGPWRSEFSLTLGRKPDTRILAGGEQRQRLGEYYRPASQKGELYLTTYQTLLNDHNEVAAFLDQNGVNAFLVVDEAHYMKQLGGEWADAVLSISKHAKFRCVLTGTPIPRSYMDVFNMFDFLWPDHTPLDQEAKQRIQIYERNDDMQSARQLLTSNIGPFSYRVRKSDLGLMPPKFHEPLLLSMNILERKVYDAIETKIRRYSKADYLKNIDVIDRLRRGRVTRLRQCVSYPKLLSFALEEYSESLIDDEPDLSTIIRDYDALETPAKLSCLTQLVRELQSQKQKVVIWAHFIGTLKLLVTHLTEAGFYCKLIYGATPTEQTSIHEEQTRETIRAEFLDTDSGLDILVANPAACAESISLHTTCFHAVYYDLSYNCAQYLQSLDRIHRVGGSEHRQANYHFLRYSNTIEQDIADNLERKAKRMYSLIDDDYAIYSMDMFAGDDELQAYKRLFGGQ
ncbi:MAG: DEAD/DEAH box helicase [Chloroflexi bacterium]|nr:DEAD/DEAH box helicase [Chloroflexota bacterium]